MSIQHGLSLSVFPRPFGVKVQWFWPEGSQEGDVVVVQALRGKGLTEPQIIRFPKDRAFINALRVGEAIQVRARMMSDASDFPDWQAGDWRNAASSTSLADLGATVPPKFNGVNVAGSISVSDPYIAEASIAPGSIYMTAGDDIEGQTLREVLVEVLPRTASRLAVQVAADMATAVSAAFKRLDNLRDTNAGKS